MSKVIQYPSPESWREMTRKQQFAWKRDTRARGFNLRYNCIKCGYPQKERNTDGCESCRPRN
jgi:hypothetical protein